jgi:hypothetical protein
MCYFTFYPNSFKSITQALLISFGIKRVLVFIVIQKSCAPCTAARCNASTTCATNLEIASLLERERDRYEWMDGWMD